MSTLIPIIISSASRSTSEDEDTEDDLQNELRGRSPNGFRNELLRHQKKISSPSVHRSSPHANSSGDSTSGLRGARRELFTRSRSPAITRPSTSKSNSRRKTSRSIFSRYIPAFPGPFARSLLPATISLHVHFPLSPWTWRFSVDTRKAGECLLLLGSLVYATQRLSNAPKAEFQELLRPEPDIWISAGAFSCLNPT